MADTDTMKFGPQWLRQLSDGGGNVCSPPPTPAANLGPFGKFKLADFRYGKEEMLALFRPCSAPPEALKIFSEILSEAGPQKPVSVAPLTEDEQRLLMHGVNSDQVYRMMSNSHRGPGAPNEQGGAGGGAGVEPGVTRPGGGGGGGTGSGGRVTRGRGGARRVAEPVGEPAALGNEAASGAEQSGAHGHPGGQPFHRSGGQRGRGSRGAAANVPENPAPGRGGGYRNRPENSQAPTEAGDSNGDWRRVSRQRNPSESDTDWRRGPRTGSTKDNLQQRSSAVGGSGGRVNTNSRGGASKNEGGGSWRQRGAPASDQRHFAASGNHSGRGRGYSRADKTNMQRSNSEEEIPEWVYEENGSDETGTGFFDSSGAYKPTNMRGGMHSRHHRVRQYSTGSSGAGSGPHNPDPDDYWEDDWETDFTLYDDLDGSGRQEAQEEKRSSSDDVDAKANERQSGEATESKEQEHSNDNVRQEASKVQPQCVVASDHVNSVRESSRSPTAKASSNVETAASLEQLISSDSSIKAVVTSSGNTGDVAAPSSLHHQPQQTRWFYRDPQGRTQGPFAATQMQEWYKAGFFDPSLAVRRECDNNFFSLDSYFKTFGSQTFIGNAPANAASLQNIPVGSPMNPDSTAMHLLLRQQKMQEMMLKQQLQSPEKSTCPPFTAQQDMLNWFMYQQQLMSSGLTAEQIEALKRQHPMFATQPTATVSTTMEANPTLLPSPTASAWPQVPSTGKMASPDAALPDDMMAWHNKLLAQQLAHQKAMRMEREEMERERAEILRQHQELLTKQSEEAEERRMRQEAEELERRRKEVEERERQLQQEEAERRQAALRQEEERRELERRRVELEESERQRRDAEEAAFQAAHAKRKKEEAERHRAEAEESERLRREAEEAAAFQAAQARRKKEETERRREEERRRQAEEEARRKQEAAEAAEERRAAEEEAAAAAAERRRRQEEEARRVQLSKFQLPESARWGSGGPAPAAVVPEVATVCFHAAAPSLAEIQRVQAEKEEREAQEKRAMRLEREAAKLSAQRQAQMGPWSLSGSGGGGAVSPTTTSPAPVIAGPVGRQKSFMEIQAEEAAREAESRHTHTSQTDRSRTGVSQSQSGKSVPAVSPAASGASIWGSNWASKVQQQPPPAVPKPVANPVSKPTPKQQQQQQQPAAAKVSVWGSAGANSKSTVSEQQSKAFPTLATAVDKPTSGAKQASSSGGKKKGSSREEERVTKLFTAVDGSKDDELTRWCKAALDRIKGPCQLDKAMFVEYLVQMETAADIEEMMTAYIDNADHIKKFVADFLEKRRRFRKAQEEGTKISFADAFTSKQPKEEEFQKVGSSNKAGGGKRNRKKKQQKVSNLLNITATADPDRFNAGEIDYAN